jgi:hypothetical protein
VYHEQIERTNGGRDSVERIYHKDLREVHNYAKHFDKVEAEELGRGVHKNITNLPLILHSLTLIKSFMSEHHIRNPHHRDLRKSFIPMKNT